MSVSELTTTVVTPIQEEDCLLDLIDEAQDLKNILPEPCDQTKAKACNFGGCALRAALSDSPDYDYDYFQTCCIDSNQS